MSTPQLTAEQRKRIHGYVRPFREYLNSPEGKRDTQDRVYRRQFFQSFTPERLAELEETDLAELVTHLWASSIFRNKRYFVERLLVENGLPKLRQALKELLWGDGSVYERYTRFLKEVKWFGPAMVTELLAHVHPGQCGIWNDRARKALVGLGFSELLPLKKYTLSAREYEKFCRVLSAIAVELRGLGIPDEPDLLLVDYFLYEVFSSQKRSLIPETLATEFDHDEIRDKIRDIGSWLGFEAEIEEKIAHGARVDVVWRARIGNLGVVTYVFEVHKGGSIDSLILNLQKARSNPTVQKVIAVSDQRQLEKLRQEVQGLPEEFRKALGYWAAAEVERVYQNLAEATEIIQRLELVREEFPIGQAELS